MSKVKEEYLKYRQQERYLGEYPSEDEVYAYIKYIKELEEQNKEMLELHIKFAKWLRHESRGTFDVDTLIEKVTEKPIEEVLKNE